MKAHEALEILSQSWKDRISLRLARGEELRGDFEELMDQFFNRLTKAIRTGDASWMDDQLKDWVLARPQTDLESHFSSLPAILNQIHQVTYEIALEKLSERDALILMQALMPIFLHTFEFAAHLEMDQNVAHISRQLEDANTHLQRLEKSKSDFIAIAAHELKTPLTLIEGYTAMVREVLNHHPEMVQVETMLKGIDNGADRLRQIIDDMIDVSLIDNNLLALNFQPLWMNGLMKVLLNEFTPVAQARGLVLEMNDFPGCNEMTFGDNERLYQAFRNIFSNAVKFTPDGGRITVDGRKLPGFIELIISDTGIGIDPDNHSRIFEKFGRLGDVSLHSSGKTKFKGGGPGLGLSITRGIIEAHGGSIWVESPGYDEHACPGSIFHVLLPMRKTTPDPKLAKLFSSLVEEKQDKIG